MIETKLNDKNNIDAVTLDHQYQLEITSEKQGIRLDVLLKEEMPHLSRTFFQSLILKKQVEVNSQTIQHKDYHVRIGDRITVHLTSLEPQATSILPNPSISVQVVYEDEHLAVIYKPAGLTTHPGAGNHQETLVNGLLAHYQGQLSADPIRPGIVHRLDRDTSGILIIAKDQNTHFLLAKAIAERAVKREYLCVTYNCPPLIAGTVKTHIAKDPNNHTKRIVVPFDTRGGKLAITNYKVLKKVEKGAFSLIKCSLETGRTHQIRVHLKHINCPLIGDKKYLESRNFNLQMCDEIQRQTIKTFHRQALHSHKLEFIHPHSNATINIISPMPNDFEELLLCLGIERKDYKEK